MPYRLVHVFAAIPLSPGAELRAFYRAVAAVNESEAMSQGVLFVPLALPEGSADKSLFQSAIDYNIRLCAYYIQAGDAPGFSHEYALALACRDDAALPMRQVAVLQEGAEFESRARSLLSGWLESPAVEVARRSADETDREFVRQLIFDLVSDELGMAAWPEAMRAPLLEIQFQARMRGIREAYPEAEEELLTANGEYIDRHTKIRSHLSGRPRHPTLWRKSNALGRLLMVNLIAALH